MRQLIKPDNFSTFCTDADFQDITNKYQIQFPEDLKQFLIEYEGVMVAAVEQYLPCVDSETVQQLEPYQFSRVLQVKGPERKGRENTTIANLSTDRNYKKMMNTNFESEIQKVCEILRTQLRTEQITELSPNHRKGIYLIAQKYSRVNFIQWLEVVVCLQYKYLLKDTFLSFYSHKLEQIIANVEGKDGEQLYYEPEMLSLDNLSRIISKYYIDNKNLVNALAVSLTILRTMETVFETYNWDTWNKDFNDTYANLALDQYSIDASCQITYMWEKNSLEIKDYWLWWLEEAIPQALEKCNEVSG